MQSKQIERTFLLGSLMHSTNFGSDDTTSAMSSCLCGDSASHRWYRHFMRYLRTRALTVRMSLSREVVSGSSCASCASTAPW